MGLNDAEPASYPSAAELKPAEDYSSGSGGRLLELYCAALENYERRLDEKIAEERKQAHHLRLYRYVSVLSGTLLAVASLALCAFGIERQTDLLPLAGVLGPVAGLAGVFIWGYRPQDQNQISKSKQPKKIPEITK